VAAIPAKNEADELEGCLLALATQRDAALDVVVLCLNNCTDGSADVVRRFACVLPFAVCSLEVSLPPKRAFAGTARRIAMDHAAELAGPRGILLSTDADGRVAPDWLVTNLAAIANGADAVAGRAEIEPVGARLIPAHLHAIDARECAYAALLDEIRCLLDPDPADPWIRHEEHSGASIAVTVDAYHRAGGIPLVPLAEDRAFFDRLRRIDAKIRHAPDVRVTVSARIVGRAPGGMADTMRRRMVQIDEFLDERLEPARDAARRAWLRARLHRAWHIGVTESADIAAMADKLMMVADDLAGLMTSRYFGAAWAGVEERSPVLRRRRVRLADLSMQTEYARQLRYGISRAANPAGTLLPVAAE
jgi:glycosyltransferase involved in cell wall biosynthesis